MIAAANPSEEAQPDPSRNAAVLAEVERCQKKSSGWLPAVMMLVISVGLFLAIGATQWSWEFVLLLMGVLFLHEMGHYLAMRLFRYRNVRMFFVPLLGAAVSGQHYNVPGWKKTIVSLMGPLPGIFLGAGAGVAGLVAGWDPLVHAALLTLILNGFNLLPILPFDGGWIMHFLLFSRHYMLDAGFRVLAVAGLMLGALAIGDGILFFLGLVMLISLPMAFRKAGVVETLRRRRVVAASPDDQSIPPETANVIVDELRRSFPQSLSNKMTAQLTVQTFEALNARPPGWLATLALAAVHLGSFLFALVFVGVLVIAQQAGLGDFFSAEISAPRIPVDPQSIEVRRGPDSLDGAEEEKTIVADFSWPGRAEAVFDQLADRIPARATLVRFGQSLLLAIPADDDAAREQWVAELEKEADKVYVSIRRGGTTTRLMARAPDAETAVRIEQTLQEYFRADSPMDLIPPWHPDLRISPEQQKARKTYLELSDGAGSHDDPRIEPLQRQMAEAFRRGDEQRAGELQRQIESLVRRAEEARLDKLEREAGDPAEAEVIKLYRQRPSFEFEAEAPADAEGDEDAEAPPPAPDADADADAVEPARQQTVQEVQEAYADWCRRMGEHLGQLPREGDVVNPSQRRFSAHGFGVTRTGLYVQVNYLSFARLVDGPPAMVQWLSDQGCAGLRYEFVAGF